MNFPQSHKPIRSGDLDDEFISFIVKLYEDDELREDNWFKIAKELNELLNKNKDKPEFVESVRNIYSAVSKLDINCNSDSEEKDN